MVDGVAGARHGRTPNRETTAAADRPRRVAHDAARSRIALVDLHAARPVAFGDPYRRATGRCVAVALRVIELPPEQVGRWTSRKVARATGAVALMNASYFDPDLKAMGAVDRRRPRDVAAAAGRFAAPRRISHPRRPGVVAAPRRGRSRRRDRGFSGRPVVGRRRRGAEPFPQSRRRQPPFRGRARPAGPGGAGRRRCVGRRHVTSRTGPLARRAGTERALAVASD